MNLIRTHAPISRPQLATLSGLSQVTVIKITNNLVESHLIRENVYAESTGGRRAGLVEINPEGGFAIGLIPHETALIGDILNLNSELVFSQQWSIALPDHGVQAIDLMAQCVEDMFSQSGIPREKIIGVGIGISGLIDAERGEYLSTISLLMTREDPHSQCYTNMIQWFHHLTVALPGVECILCRGRGP